MEILKINGDITISIPKNAPLRINAHAINGAISNQVPVTISEKTRMGLAGMTANYTGGVYIEANTVNSGIDVTTH